MQIDPIENQPGREADAMVTLSQIGQGNLMGCGARDFVRDDPNGMIKFRVGPERAWRRVTVKLMGNDTYTVEVGHTDRRTFEYVADAQEGGIYCDQLGETVRRLGDI
jgi:hypothetical protein